MCHFSKYYLVTFLAATTVSHQHDGSTMKKFMRKMMKISYAALVATTVDDLQLQAVISMMAVELRNL